MSRFSNAFFYVIAALVLIEYYAYVAITTAFRNTSGTPKIVVMTVYALLSIAAIFLVFTIRRLDLHLWNPTIRTITTALFMGFVLAKLVAASFMVVDDLRRVVLWAYQATQGTSKTVAASGMQHSGGITRSQFIAKAALFTGGLLMGGFAWGTRNKYRYQIKKVKVRIPNLPASFRGMKIVQISDIHSGSFDDKAAVAHGIDLVMQQQADIIVFTGDLVNDKAEEIVPYKDIFKRLKAPMGVYSILGNHDYGDYHQWESAEAKAQNLEALKQHQADMGWQLLMNEHVIFERNQEKIALLGIENWGAKAHFPKYGKMDKAYAGLENENIAAKILLSHDPSHWDHEVLQSYKDIDLTLSGHTHGMQAGIRLPFLKWSPVKFVYKHWEGLYAENNQQLYVNVGYGFLGYPGRLGILPEITVIEFV